MKLVIDIHKEQYEFIKQGMSIDKITQFPALMEAICEHIANGTPLDSVKAKIEKKYREVEFMDEFSSGYNYAIGETLETLDNIGKSCSTCKNNDDELSGECYECLKGMFDHYEAEGSEPNE